MIKIKNVVNLQQLKNSKNSLLFVAFLILISFLLKSCSSNKDNNEDVIKEKRPNPNLIERAKENAEKNPLFSSIGKKNSGGNFEFSTSNILWRATLQALDFIPLNNTDYSGGVIVTDWYGSSAEQIKISIRFLSNELNSSSIKVTAHKRECVQNNCNTKPASESFNLEIKEKIIKEARAIKIEDEKKKK